MSNQLHTACLVCEGTKLHHLKGYEKHGLLKCNGCGFVFMDRIPTPEELDVHYSAYTYDREVGDLSSVTIKSYNTLLDELEPYRKSNRLLDVGCGRGWFLIEAKKRGWEVYGTEFSETAITLCESKGIKMKQGELSSDMFDFDFDVITSFEVIEHIYNPHEKLENISKLLRKDGLFYCTTPNFNSLQRYQLKAEFNVIEYPEHLSYYTKSTLNKVVSAHGLQPIKFLSTGVSVTRFQQSVGKPHLEESDDDSQPAISSDDALRNAIDQKWHLGVAKNIVNKCLTISNTGLTLKGYYRKK